MKTFVIVAVIIAFVAAEDDLCQTTGICDHVVLSVRNSLNSVCANGECSCNTQMSILTDGEVWDCLVNEDCSIAPAGNDPDTYARWDTNGVHLTASSMYLM